MGGDWGLQVDRVLPALPKIASPNDTMVLNFGLHHHTVGDYIAALKHFAEYHRQHHTQLPFMVWMDTAPQHFDTPSGTPLPRMHPQQTTPPSF